MVDRRALHALPMQFLHDLETDGLIQPALATFLGQFEQDRAFDGAQCVQLVLLPGKHGRLDVGIDTLLQVHGGLDQSTLSCKYGLFRRSSTRRSPFSSVSSFNV